MDDNLVSKTQTTRKKLEYPKGCELRSLPRNWNRLAGVRKKVWLSALTGALATSRRWYQSPIRPLSAS